MPHGTISEAAPPRRGTAELLPHQLELVADRTTPIRVLSGGYRSGKTVAGVAAVVDMAFRAGGYPILVVEPTYRMIVDVFVATATRMLTSWRIRWSWRKTDKILTIGARHPVEVWCRSADDPRSLEGITAGGCLVDEWELCSREAIGVALARVSQGPCQQVVLTGTPEGYGPAYEMILGTSRTDVRQWVVRTSANAYLGARYVDSLRANLDDDTATEKIDGIRTAKGGRVYSRFARDVHTSTPCVKPVTAEIQIACDFNVGHMHWLVVTVNQDEQKCHVVGEIVGHNVTTDEQAERAAEWIADYLTRTRHRRVTREGVRAMRIEAYCDASGASRSSVTPQTHVSLLTQAGFRPRHGAANPLVDDRINTVQVLLRDRRITVDPSVRGLIRSLEHQAYVGGRPDKSGDLDHCLDALGYLCHWQWPVGRHRANTVEGTPVEVADAWGPTR